ncbi:hypothetical protein OTU49_000125 [Cherax quadricarinatus]|uniref:A-kinase anchor protein 2 C-terminal domain-containing protein n=1 Tax=Cherax quadricarinatus TaxID=27406 RepID=A0AAW0XZM2_CHEQU
MLTVAFVIEPMQKESVIEREIRLAREREEAYRREKGLTASINSSTSRSSSQTTLARTPPVVNNDGRDVQHRLATNRIQLEIQETSMKEMELRDAGKILTMSEDTVDAKLTRGFGEKYIFFERPVKVRRKKFMKTGKPFTGVDITAAVIQRETLARMKPQPVDSNIIQDNTSQSQKPTNHIQQQYRRSYCTAEEKIQSELKEMQMREEELRQLRACQMAQSQPNLMDLDAEEDEHEEVESNHSYQEMNGLRTTYSNPNLLDDEPTQTQVMDKGMRRRSALIAQWENLIQQTTDT